RKQENVMCDGTEPGLQWVYHKRSRSRSGKQNSDALAGRTAEKRGAAGETASGGRRESREGDG
ncbi:hypothetical protein ACLOJK_008159, partial [Asimina triloba]